jgi:16S rRNA (guanine527-N7)-methyltransferase
MALSRPAAGWEPLVERVLGELAPELRERASPFGRLLDLVVDWNRRIDLTAARSAEELVDLYLADAAVIARSATPGRWVDVGAGAGAPGLPLALLAPELEISLVEPKSKRVAFLRTAIGLLGRSDVGVRRARSNELGAGQFDAAISRATLSAAEWLEEGTRLARREVWALLARAEPERRPGWRADLDVEYAWPLTHARRRAVRYVPELG